MDFATNPLGLVTKSKPQLVEILNDTYHAEHKPTYEVLMHLAVCHTVVVDKNKGVYNAASPDEQALVEGAKDQGFEFVGRETDNVIVVKDPQGYSLRYKVLNVLEFNSTRKRMSIIVQNQQTGYIELYSKGADSIMEKLLLKGDREQDLALEQTNGFIDLYSKEGLRTLMLTKKDISQREYDAWNAKWEQAQLTIENRDDIIMAVSAEIEQDMMLVGSTAIEDRLQDDVKETIVSLKDAGIKIWVLTGDKIETAIQIGFSTGLLNDEMGLLKVDGTEFREIS
jgi:magnesium-transporting ATPase (P-type)